MRISRLSLLPTPPSASLPPVPARSNYLFAQADDSVGEGDRFSPYFYRIVHDYILFARALGRCVCVGYDDRVQCMLCLMNHIIA